MSKSEIAVSAIISSCSLSESSVGSNKSSIISDVGIQKSQNGSYSFMSLVMSLDVSIISPGSLLSKRSSSVQMSSVLKFRKGFFRQ